MYGVEVGRGLRLEPAEARDGPRMIWIKRKHPVQLPCGESLAVFLRHKYTLHFNW